MKFKMYMEQIWHYNEIFEADNYEEALEIAGNKCCDISPMDYPMTFSDENCDVVQLDENGNEITKW